MNDWLQAILLGVVQGLTEFLPVSSSGHLVLAQQLLGASFSFADAAVAFDLALHVGTLIPVLYFYRRSIGEILSSLLAWRRDEHFRMAWMVVLATIPTGLIGVLFKDTFESLFHSVRAVGVALLFTGGLLWATRNLGRAPAAVDGAEPRVRPGLTPFVALAIGLAQGLAITPGISRSGTTIAVALLLGVEREVAARFSFLLSIPAILGAVVLMAKDGVGLGQANPGALGAGFVAALVVGYFALRMLVALVKRGGLHKFAYYLWPVAIVALIADLL